MPAEPHRSTTAPRPFRPARPVVIGLLGGIAAGKSTVAALFAARGLRHVSADAHAHAVAGEPAVVAEVSAAFGPGVTAGGRLDRAAMAAVVFRDPSARAQLEAILHPRIRARILAELAAARAAGTSVLLDAPLLLETGLIECCDEVVFVDADETERRRRAALRGWPAGELERREAAQAPLASKRARAGHTVDNGGDLAATARQVDAVLAALEAAPR
ncbi:MAG: dephospho-CoA kinase [Planctomycetes bacterium]|nr:dephospho-CoA kinase [Planctomycetota bacterium]